MIKKQKGLRSSRGFTLVELLVVIAIIGILAALVLVALGSARQKARDAARQSDVRQMGLAMEMAYDDDAAYPDASAYTTGSAIASSTSTYLDAIPADPQAAAYAWVDNSVALQTFCVSGDLEGGDFFACDQDGCGDSATADCT